MRLTCSSVEFSPFNLSDRVIFCLVCDHLSESEILAFDLLFGNRQKVVQISCGWRHTLAVTDRQNVYSWGRGTNGQLGHGQSSDRNVPIIIEPLSLDGSSGQHIESSNIDSSSGKTWVSPSERYAVVPDDSVGGGNGSDISVPETDVKRVRV
ncbi:hypothetical protein Pint_27438 [Pistacia integerrima]|uniref:Uncharacterized protein n=1 Tax=Pistacia integerrima TaxID=434235 RepID=A0ACC0YQ71_9ROSI|nr:hypothetical protein Pint_27438 [Pistacia integerrima]